MACRVLARSFAALVRAGSARPDLDQRRITVAGGMPVTRQGRNHPLTDRRYRDVAQLEAKSTDDMGLLVRRLACGKAREQGGARARVLALIEVCWLAGQARAVESRIAPWMIQE